MSTQRSSVGYMRLRRDHQAGYNRHQVGYMRLCGDHQVSHRLIRITDTGWPKCTDCTDFYPGNTPVFKIFTHFSKFFMKISKKISSK